MNNTKLFNVRIRNTPYVIKYDTVTKEMITTKYDYDPDLKLELQQLLYEHLYPATVIR
jgi:hypothetical protein